MSSHKIWRYTFSILVLAGLIFSLVQPGVAGAMPPAPGGLAITSSPAGDQNTQPLQHRPAATTPFVRLQDIQPGQDNPAAASQKASRPSAQSPLRPVVKYAVRNDVSPALRDTPTTPPRDKARKAHPEPVEIPLLPLPGRDRSKARKELGPDPALQTYSPGTIQVPTPSVNFEGISNADNEAILGFLLSPPDTEGDVGPNHYVQMVNLAFSVWDKSGNLLLGPLPNNALWSGFGGPCETSNDGDPIVLYDHLADRWLMSQFAVPGPFFQCIAISQTPDPTGAWYRYEFFWDEVLFNDYPKFGVWSDGYYMSVNQFDLSAGEIFAGAGVAAFERDQMLQGLPARMVAFLDLGPTTGGMLPSDLDGPPPPAGTPDYFVQFDDDDRGAPADQLQIWEFSVDWVNPANSVFAGPTLLATTPFNSVVCPNFRGECIVQPDTFTLLEDLDDRLMFRLQYRNFGSHQTLVTNHTVNADGAGQAGLRWYELRNSGGGWSIFQQGTYAGDTANSDHRWMGSIAMDGSGNLALGYSVSGDALYPSIRYVGRLETDPAGTMSRGETTLMAGGGSQTESGRWGDYSMMAVDPTDECTFWYTQEYVASTDELFGLGWRTRIGAFRYPAPACIDVGIGTLQGTVTDAATGNPIANAKVDVDGYTAYTDASGFYQFTNLPVDNYNVIASAYGYDPGAANGVVVTDGGTTIQDFALSPAPSVPVSGTVTDANTGWPLYARIDISATGFNGTIFTDPETGGYGVNLPQGTPHVFEVSALIDGYNGEIRAVIPPPGGITAENFALTVDAVTCNAPGYEFFFDGLFEQFESGTTPAAWTVVDHASSGEVWRFDDPAGRGNLTGGSNGFAIIDSDFYGPPPSPPEDTELQTPSLDFSSDPTVLLEFDTDFNQYSGFETVDVDVSIDGGGNWTNVLALGDKGGFTGHVSLDISSIASGQSNVIVRFHYIGNFDWWWQVDNVLVGPAPPNCEPQPGGLVVGNVYDANTGAAVNRASVSNDSGDATTTVNTPDDPAVDDGFYALFSPAGLHTFTAIASKYGIDTQMPLVVANDTIRQDFNLPAGQLTVMPPSLDLTVPMGSADVLTLALSNSGGWPATFELLERNQGSVVLSPLPGNTPEQRTFRDWGKSPQLEERLQLDIKTMAASVLPIIISDPPGDASGVDVTTVEGISTATDLTLRLKFSPGAGPTDAVGFVHLDTDQDAATGYPPAVLFGLATQDIGYDYYLSLFSLPDSVDIFDANDFYIASVTPVYTADALEFTLPLSALGNDDGNVDVTMALGKWSGLTDWAPDAGHGSISAFVDVPWLSEDPISGTVASLAAKPIMITFNAGVPEVTQPGRYYAQLKIVQDTPYNLASVPVTMTVTSPAEWGKLTGTVNGLGYCDVNPAPLENVNLFLESSTGMTWTVTTDISGTYAVWLDESNSPLTATLSHPGYVTQTLTGISVTAGITTTSDFELRLAAPCVSVDPHKLSVTVTMGTSTTLPLTLSNIGAAAANFEMVELDRGHTLLLPRVLVPGYQVAEQTTGSYAGQHLVSRESWSYKPSEEALLGIPADVLLLAAADVTQIQTILQAYPDIALVDYFDARLASPTLSQLLAYDTVIVIASYAFANPTAVGNVLADYVDGGGTVIQTVPTFYDPFGFGWGLQGRFVTDGYSPFIGTGDWFLWADLGTFNASHPIMQGVTSAGDLLRQVVDLAPDADLVAEWTDDEFVATKGSVVALNTFLADGYSWTGDVDLIVHNSIIWLQTRGDVPWLSEDPVTGTVAANSGTQLVDVTFDASVPEVTEPGGYYGTLLVSSNDPVNSFIGLPVTMTVISYGVTIEPPVDTKSGDPGTTVTYTLQMTNTGMTTDTFDVVASDNIWATTMPAMVGPLPAGVGADLNVSVTIPATAMGGTQDSVTITVISQGDNRQSDTAILTTVANKVYGVTVAPPASANSGAPGDLVTYSLWVTNTGNTTDTYVVTTSGNAWPVVAPLGPGASSVTVVVGPLSAGASDESQLLVIIPAAALIGATDTATLTFTSQGDTTKSATSTLTTTAGPTVSPSTIKLFLPVILKQ